jgi:hypothetical protein
VKRVREGVYLTPFGEQRLDAALLTNDMAKARAARDADRVAQELLKARQPVAVAATPAPAATPTPRYVEGVNTQSSGLQTSSALGAGHTKVDGGVLWQKSRDGRYWIPVKYVKNGGTQNLPPQVPVK